MPDGAEEDHAGDLSEQLEESDDEANGAHHVEPGDQPHLYGLGAAFLVPQLVPFLVVETAAVPFPLYAARVRHSVLRRPRVDPVPVGVITHAAAMELKSSWENINEIRFEICLFDIILFVCLFIRENSLGGGGEGVRKRMVTVKEQSNAVRQCKEKNVNVKETILRRNICERRRNLCSV